MGTSIDKPKYYKSGDGEEIELLLHSHDVGYCCKCMVAINGTEISAERANRWIRKEEKPICFRCRKTGAQLKRFLLIFSSLISVILITSITTFKFLQSSNGNINETYPTFAGIGWTASKSTASLQMRERGYILKREDLTSQLYEAKIIGENAKVTLIYNDRDRNLEKLYVEFSNLNILDRERVETMYNQILIALQNNYGTASSVTQENTSKMLNKKALWMEKKGGSYPAPYLSVHLKTGNFNSLLVTYLSPSETQLVRARKTRKIYKTRLQSKIDDF